MKDEYSKCDRCIHYVTSSVLNNDLFHVEYAYSCELNLINCDEHFEEEIDD